MPSFLSEGEHVHLSSSVYPEPPHQSHEKQPAHSIPPLTNGHNWEGTNGYKHMDGVMTNGTTSSLHSPPNGRSSGSTYSREKQHSRDGSLSSDLGMTAENGISPPGPPGHLSKVGQGVHSYFSSGLPGRAHPHRSRPKSPEGPSPVNGDGIAHSIVHSATEPITHPQSDNANTILHPATTLPSATSEITSIHTASHHVHRYSSPPAPSSTPGASSLASVQLPAPPRLQHRHTLQVPKLSTSRTSRDFSTANPNTSEDIVSNSGRFSPTGPGGRRTSITLGRRVTRSIHSDMHIDEIPPDDDAARWAEAIRQKRASKRKRKEEEDDDRVVVGTKVDMHHVNWVTAYNMLTGIRFTVSRTNAKMDRELTDQDFDARHKFSFDITGNELTPSAKYDFKFKDYAPWVFRHLRNKFNLDPADYLMSLTSKYILSELGSPGKSGSFFYFSRDYKYIIKTIHHAEHKLLLKILREYYQHVERNPNTLLSQFYGLHRVKIPYGRKIHFVVMNNLFPPHRDIHQTFDLKGSTIGRDFREEDLAKHPRATMKDLNWLRRNLHLELGSAKKHIFVAQMERDVKLLQRLKIMDYSLLVGIHDLEKGNEENLRDKTLQVFHPGGDPSEEPQQNMLTRTPSKLENVRKARELRQIIKKEKPVPMRQSTSKMPDEMLEERKDFIFYSDDGGFRATHEDGEPGEEIYYLGIIDCLTHYGFVKKAEHFWKGMDRKHVSQISPIPPEGYGDRFIKFITGITKTREAAQLEDLSRNQADGSIDSYRNSNQPLQRSSTERVMAIAEKQADKTKRRGISEDSQPDRILSAVRSPSAERTNGIAGAILPVVEEAGEAGSTGGRSGRSGDESIMNEKVSERPIVGSSNMPSNKVGLRPPPTPPIHSTLMLDKHLPTLPPLTSLTASPSPIRPSESDDLESAIARLSA
ncbi:MAG: Phosphatidylinositol-4-phosphate 5-kinase [Pycnora praestabilis]|nr:MAG: Phosphatidylinositol-4-phosphate 5-kinase [Pycnora praestabilis]